MESSISLQQEKEDPLLESDGLDLFLGAGKLVIDGVVGRRISQDPGHAIGRYCNVPERLRGRPSSQILDSGRLQAHESREHSKNPGKGPAKNLIFPVIGRSVIASPPLSTSEET